MFPIEPSDFYHGPSNIFVLFLGKNTDYLSHDGCLVGLSEQQVLTHVVDDSLKHEFSVALLLRVGTFFGGRISSRFFDSLRCRIFWQNTILIINLHWCLFICV